MLHFVADAVANYFYQIYGRATHKFDNFDLAPIRINMLFKDWIIGAVYSVKDKGGTLTELGRLIHKHDMGDHVALDFRKDDGEEHMYIVEEGLTYLVNTSPSLPPL